VIGGTSIAVGTVSVCVSMIDDSKNINKNKQILFKSFLTLFNQA
jgi:hypothetical protein